MSVEHDFLRRVGQVHINIVHYAVLRSNQQGLLVFAQKNKFFTAQTFSYVHVLL